MSDHSPGTKITFFDGTVGVLTGTPGEAYTVTCGGPYRPLPPLFASWSPETITEDGASATLNIVGGSTPYYIEDVDWLVNIPQLLITYINGVITITVDELADPGIYVGIVRAVVTSTDGQETFADLDVSITVADDLGGILPLFVFLPQNNTGPAT
jgi:hypothetical protein